MRVQPFLERPSFQKVWRKYHISMYFFEKDHLSFSVQVIFSGKTNIIFPDNIRKIIFQCNFFRKTIFSGRLEKENMVFRAVICTPPLAVHSQHVATKSLWWWGGWAHWIVFMMSLYMYYALCFVHVEHSVCHELISVLIYIYIYIYLYIYI